MVSSAMIAMMSQNSKSGEESRQSAESKKRVSATTSVTLVPSVLPLTESTIVNTVNWPSTCFKLQPHSNTESKTGPLTPSATNPATS